MVFDSSLSIYIPVAWVLMSGKTEECYWQAFNWLCSEVNECAPFCVGVDFERAFFRCVSLHFPDARLIGCLFHFKQAGRKKMKELGIDKDQIEFAMRVGVYDLLTVIPKDEMKKGVHYVRTLIADHLFEMKCEGDDDFAKWDTFFDDYFEK